MMPLLDILPSELWAFFLAFASTAVLVLAIRWAMNRRGKDSTDN